MSLVELIEPRAVHSGIAAVPAEVVVVGNHVGNLKIGIVHLAHGNSRNSSLSGAVHLVAEVVQNSVVLQKILVGAADRDLVRETPYHDRGVIIVLRDKLGHL